jgi:nucleotide-binding universal stress UspA family protein
MADVIVIAIHGHKGFARLFLGSVAERIAREARPSVVTVRSEVTLQPRPAY